MYRKLVILLAVLAILLVTGESKASLIRAFLKSTEIYNSNNKSIEMPPSLSPVPSIGSDNFDGDTSSKADPIGTVIEERCQVSSSNWCRALEKVTACLPFTGSGPKGSFLIIQNDGESSLNVSLTFLPPNSTLEAVELQEHQAKKINISENVGGSRSIVVNVGTVNCTVDMESPAPEDNSGQQMPSGVRYVNPMHGAYLLVLIVLVAGGAWALFKLRKRERHLDGVPYQELEMGKPESLSAVNTHHTADGWDKDWDDDWDEEKAVKSPDLKHKKNGYANGHSRSSDADGWGNDWDG